MLFTQLPGLLEDLKALVRPYEETAPELVRWVEGLSIDGEGIEARLIAFLKDDRSGEMIGTVISEAVSIFGMIFSMAFALIIAFSAVSQKERLARQAQTLLYACMSEPRAGKIVQYVRRIRSIFVSFISGQVLEAFILGSMVFAGMVIFRFPHALSIGALVMLMAFVPIVGAWVSAIIGAILILATDGLGKALGFVVLIIVIQQIEGNLIYPKVMGKRVPFPPCGCWSPLRWAAACRRMGQAAVRAGFCHRLSVAPLRSIPAGRGKALQRTHNARPSSAKHISPYR